MWTGWVVQNSISVIIETEYCGPVRLETVSTNNNNDNIASAVKVIQPYGIVYSRKVWYFLWKVAPVSYCMLLFFEIMNDRPCGCTGEARFPENCRNRTRSFRCESIKFFEWCKRDLWSATFIITLSFQKFHKMEDFCLAEYWNASYHSLRNIYSRAWLLLHSSKLYNVNLRRIKKIHSQEGIVTWNGGFSESIPQSGEVEFCRSQLLFFSF